MQIDKLDIENFQLFANQSFEFHERFNLVVGVNGSGKTSLLRALAVALGGWAHAYIKDERNHRPILDDEIREVHADGRFDKTKFTQVKASGKAAVIDRNRQKKEGFVIWSRSRTEGTETTKVVGSIQYGSYPTEYALNFGTLGNDALMFIDEGEKFALPLFAFYECDRIWKSAESIDAVEASKVKYSRFDAYRDCFHTGANHKQLGEWLLRNEMASAQKREDTPVLLSIRAAAKVALEGCTGIRFDFDESRVLVEFDNDRVVPFEHLSDGQRTMLGLFCDLARRAAVLNPHLGGDASLHTKGVVLIDELDLHLHPRWQRQIIHGLSSLFPKIQFICTTHSPFVIQALEVGKLIILGGEGSGDINRMSIEDIAEEIQGIESPQRSQRHQDMIKAAEAYFKVLRAAQACDDATPHDDATLASLKAQLDILSAPFSNDPAYQAFLNVERLAILGDRNA
jgi:predicted ATP-binding protein involved in virulence